jgi:hypothetical protein
MSVLLLLLLQDHYIVIIVIIITRQWFCQICVDDVLMLRGCGVVVAESQ